jgi:hypothetical protein
MRLGNPVLTSYGTGTPVNNVTPSELALISTYWINDTWGAGIDLSDYTVIGLGPNRSATQARNFQAYNDFFYGVAGHWRMKVDRNTLLYAHVSGQIGTAVNNFGGGKPSGDSILLGTFNYERSLSYHHGFAVQAGLEFVNVTSTGQGTLADTNYLANAFYKYSF